MTCFGTNSSETSNSFLHIRLLISVWVSLAFLYWVGIALHSDCAENGRTNCLGFC